MNRHLMKSTYDIAAAAKRKLSVLKADLRAAGLPATESTILEYLIDDADVKTLARRFKEAAKRTTR